MESDSKCPATGEHDASTHADFEALKRLDIPIVAAAAPA
jgi:hypothetical protein